MKRGGLYLSDGGVHFTIDRNDPYVCGDSHFHKRTRNKGKIWFLVMPRGMSGHKRLKMGTRVTLAKTKAAL